MTLTGREIKLILFSGILLYFSFPYYPTGFLSLIAIIPVFVLLEQQNSFRYGFKIGYWFGVVYTAFVFYWIANNILLTAILVPFINGIFYGLFWGLFVFLKRKLEKKVYVLLPFLWVAFEFSREFTDLRFNWLSLAHTFTYYKIFIQFIDITGYLGISFLIIVSNILIYFSYRLYRFNKKRYMTILLLIWSPFLIYSIVKYISLQRQIEESPRMKVAYLQPNIDPWLKWEPELQQMSVDTLYNGTKKLIKEGVDLIVWPETATPFFLKQKRNVMERIQYWTGFHSFYLLTGTLDYQLNRNAPRGYYTYNSAFLFGPDIEGYRKYNKKYLVPGAEVVPFYSLLKPIADRIDLGQGNFQPGKYSKVFQMTTRLLRHIEKFPGQTIRFGVGICYDSVFPALFREYMKQDAHFFVIITNDGWFGKTTGPYQHKQIAVLRAIENHRSIVRCANTGISCFIMPDGKIYNESRIGVTKVSSFRIPLFQQQTFYSKYRPWFELLSVTIAVLGMGFAFLRKKGSDS
jgi:apolipoprotein N-acyltransferase